MSTSNFQTQKVLAFVVWVVYQISRLSLGLVVHPYRTVREIMRGRWFVPLVFLPSGLFLWIYLSGRVASWALELPTGTRDLVGFLYTTLIFSLLFWQFLLVYLGIRFGFGLRRSSS